VGVYSGQPKDFHGQKRNCFFVESHSPENEVDHLSQEQPVWGFGRNPTKYDVGEFIFHFVDAKTGELSPNS
jgi:hypothetical protein